jgi:hypothetical protein
VPTRPQLKQVKIQGYKARAVERGTKVAEEKED